MNEGDIMRITVLNENMVYKKNLIAEHGLSVLIEFNNKKILLDTGQSDVFIKNAKTLGVDLNNLDAIIISHGHYDHGGGLDYLNEINNIPNIYISTKALIPKFSINKKKNKYYFNGIDVDDNIKNHFHYIDDKEEIFKGVYLISNIPYSNDFESKPRGFYIKQKDKMLPDLMYDEQILVVETSNGLSLFMGCSHMGIINAVSYVKDIFKDKKIYSLFAGMHLINADKNRINKTVEMLKEENINHIMPCHCTGYKVSAKISEELKDSFIEVQCGSVIEI